MFRYQNNDNYYRLSFNSRYSFCRLEKKVAGNFFPLLTNARGYRKGQQMDITIEVIGSLIQIYLNGDPVFSLSDSSLAWGTVALYCQGETKFDNVLIEENSSESSVVISVPLSYSVEVTDILNVSAFATNIPLDGWVEFVLDDHTSSPDYEFPYSAEFLDVLQGEHQIEAILHDPSSPLSSDINETIGVLGDYYIALGDSITNGTRDNYSLDNMSEDGRISSSRGFHSRLSDLLTSTVSYPNIIFNEGIPGDKSYDAAYLSIDSILKRHPQSNKALILLGTNDSSGDELSVPSGLDCSGTACEGTFKGNMRELIDKIVLSGKDVVVGLVPPAFISDGTPNTSRNLKIEEYNEVIKGSDFDPLTGYQLGPDFFSFFLDLDSGKNRSSLFADTLHPNGRGYVVMAYLWHNTLTGTSITPFILEDLTPLKYKQNLLEAGNIYYVDETYVLTTIPVELESGIWIMTANSDKDNTNDNNYLSFFVDEIVTVYVAYDSNASVLPDWLNSFTYTGSQLTVTDPLTSTLELYRADNMTGNISLGGNLASPASGATSNYIVIIQEN